MDLRNYFFWKQKFKVSISLKIWVLFVDNVCLLITKQLPDWRLISKIVNHVNVLPIVPTPMPMKMQMNIPKAAHSWIKHWCITKQWWTRIHVPIAFQGVGNHVQSFYGKLSKYVPCIHLFTVRRSKSLWNWILEEVWEVRTEWWGKSRNSFTVHTEKYFVKSILLL